MTMQSPAHDFTLMVERDIHHPPERVWRALTEPGEIARWFFAIAFRAETGHRFRIVGEAVPGWRGFTDCEVLALEPPRRMVWSFACTDGPPTRVTFEIEPKDRGSKLRITHEGAVPPDTLKLLDAGWNSYADRLGRMLA